jgi:hypothetical protein
VTADRPRYSVDINTGEEAFDLGPWTCGRRWPRLAFAPVSCPLTDDQYRERCNDLALLLMPRDRDYASRGGPPPRFDSRLYWVLPEDCWRSDVLTWRIAAAQHIADEARNDDAENARRWSRRAASGRHLVWRLAKEHWHRFQCRDTRVFVRETIRRLQSKEERTRTRGKRGRELVIGLMLRPYVSHNPPGRPRHITNSR